jgi:hypothetical protein
MRFVGTPESTGTLRHAKRVMLDSAAVFTAV